MGVWDNYSEIVDSRESTHRDYILAREKRQIKSRIKNSLSFHTVCISNHENWYEQDVAIINSDNLNEKTIISLPDDDILLGGTVHWRGEHWIITERDANNEVYTKGKMIQCNYLLKWVDDNDIIHEQWSVVEDGTKYLTGEFEDRNFIVTRGDSRIAVTIPRSPFTSKFNRESRFLIDDPESDMMLAYALTKPLKVGGVYNNLGCFKFVMQEVNTTEMDNLEYGIADYYRHFPRDDKEYSPTEPAPVEREGWL